jgi:hypothetical protein
LTVLKNPAQGQFGLNFPLAGRLLFQRGFVGLDYLEQAVV